LSCSAQRNISDHFGAPRDRKYSEILRSAGQELEGFDRAAMSFVEYLYELGK
jgi:hypothetical protein